MSTWSEQWATWASYTLADLLMFSPRTYYRLFETYNAAVWPGHVLAAVIGSTILFCALKPGRNSGRLAAGLLAASWCWVGWAFLATRYAPINWAADYFAYGFLLQALLLLWYGVLRGQVVFAKSLGRVSRLALGMTVGAMFAYPLLALVFGRPWQQAEVFSLAPDPTAIATLGVLLLACRSPAPLLLIPLLWCAITGATLLTMRAPDAWIAPSLAILSLGLAAARMAGRGSERQADRQ